MGHVYGLLQDLRPLCVSRLYRAGLSFFIDGHVSSPPSTPAPATPLPSSLCYTFLVYAFFLFMRPFIVRASSNTRTFLRLDSHRRTKKRTQGMPRNSSGADGHDVTVR